MSEYRILGATLTNIADAIRYKTGDAEEMTPEEMPEKIRQFQSVKDTAGPASMVSITDGRAAPVDSLTVGIEPVQSGSGDPSPENVRPITGRDSVEVVRAGRNLCQLGSGNIINGLHLIPVDVGDELYCYVEYMGTEQTVWGGVFNNPQNNSKSTGLLIRYPSPVLHSGDYVKFTITVKGYFGLAYNTTASLYTITKAMISKQPFEISEYVEYSEARRNIQLPATVYGGTLTIHGDGSGSLTMSRAMKQVLSSDIKNTSSALAGRYFSAGNFVTDNKAGGELLCNAFLGVKYNVSNVAGVVYISSNRQFTFNTEFSTLADFRSWIDSNPLYVVYSLADPVAYTLTAQQITTLLGVNNIWADSGNTTVTYECDIDLYIERKIEEGVNANE